MGRKWTVVWSSSLFCIGAVLMGIALDVYTLIFGRLVIGVAIGVASMTVPVYIAEVAPESIRGSLVSFDVLLITAGQFGAYVIDAIFIHVPGTWRWMLGLGAVPALVQGIGMFFLPESPRILVSNGDSNAALNLLIRTRSSVDVARRELSEIEQECREEAEAFGTRSVLSIIRSDAGLMRAVAIGVGLQIFQQICGINTVMYARQCDDATKPRRHFRWLTVGLCDCAGTTRPQSSRWRASPTTTTPSTGAWRSPSRT